MKGPDMNIMNDDIYYRYIIYVQQIPDGITKPEPMTSTILFSLPF